MSSKPSPSIDVDCRPGRATRLVAACVLVVIAGAPWLVWGGPVAFAIAGGGVALAVAGFGRAGWWGRSALVSAHRGLDGSWRLKDRTGQEVYALLGPESRVFPPVLWLSWHTTEGRRCALLARAGSAEARRLAVRLRFGLCGPAGSGSP